MKARLIITLFVALFLLGCAKTEPRTLNTNGQATLTVEPDQAIVRVAIETLKDTAQASKNVNSEITDKVQKALADLKLPKENIETEYFNLYEEFEWTEQGQKSKGFKTVHTLKITTQDFNQVGQIIDAVIEAGATRIDSVNFDLSEAKQKEYKKQALAKAAEDAKEKAETLAAGFGAELGKLVSVSDASYSYLPYRLYESSMGAQALKEVASTSLSPKKLEVTANVQVVYQIK